MFHCHCHLIFTLKNQFLKNNQSKRYTYVMQRHQSELMNLSKSAKSGGGRILESDTNPQ
jgi:hypothetical protein